jgi:nicotinate-nucleotide adenylyltransferase
VLLMPANASPHKQQAPDPGPAHRLRMCELAAAGEPGVQACALEIDRGGASYTVDTLRHIKARDPQAALTFIVGADVAAGFGSWREPAEILHLARLAVVARTGDHRETVLAALRRVRADPGNRAGTGETGTDAHDVGPAFLDMPPVDVSSSLVRARVAAGESIAELVAPAVAGYIAEHGLYRAPDRAGSER